jgi:hypothetical protein
MKKSQKHVPHPAALNVPEPEEDLSELLHENGLRVEHRTTPCILAPMLTELSDDDRRFLNGPFIVADGAPSWLAELARNERFEIVTKIKPMIVGPLELAAFEPDGELFLWAAVNASAWRYRVDPKAIWKAIGKTPIADKDVVDPKGRLWSEYETAANQVRRWVIQAAIEEEREEAEREERREKYERDQREYRERQNRSRRPDNAQGMF